MPIITAFDNWLNKYSSCPNGNHKMLTVTQLRNKGKVKGERRQRGQQQGRQVFSRVELRLPASLASPAPSWCSGFSSQGVHFTFPRSESPLKETQASNQR